MAPRCACTPLLCALFVFTCTSSTRLPMSQLISSHLYVDRAHIQACPHTSLLSFLVYRSHADPHSHALTLCTRREMLGSGPQFASWPIIAPMPSYGQGRDHIGPRRTALIGGVGLTDIKVASNDVKCIFASSHRRMHAFLSCIIFFYTVLFIVTSSAFLFLLRACLHVCLFVRFCLFVCSLNVC
jgi:hypothetical protein